MKILQTEKDDALKGSVAGGIQNLSREAASRLLIKQFGAVDALVALLSSTDVQASVCSAGDALQMSNVITIVCVLGALLNILGSGMSPCQRHRLCKMISSILTLSAANSSLQKMESSSEKRNTFV